MSEPRCSAWMPIAKERCVLPAGHKSWCMTERSKARARKRNARRRPYDLDVRWNEKSGRYVGLVHKP